METVKLVPDRNVSRAERRNFTVESLRSMLTNLTWNNFWGDHSIVIPETGVCFNAKIGIYLGRSMLMITAAKQIVVCQGITLGGTVDIKHFLFHRASKEYLTLPKGGVPLCLIPNTGWETYIPSGPKLSELVIRTSA